MSINTLLYVPPLDLKYLSLFTAIESPERGKTEMTNIKKFPSKENRVEHEYYLENCAGCHEAIAENESYTEIVMTSVSGKNKKHIALCDECAEEARRHGVI